MSKHQCKLHTTHCYSIGCCHLWLEVFHPYCTCSAPRQAPCPLCGPLTSGWWRWGRGGCTRALPCQATGCSDTGSPRARSASLWGSPSDPARQAWQHTQWAAAAAAERAPRRREAHDLSAAPALPITLMINRRGSDKALHFKEKRERDWLSVWQQKCIAKQTREKNNNLVNQKYLTPPESAVGKFSNVWVLGKKYQSWFTGKIWHAHTHARSHARTHWTERELCGLMACELCWSQSHN